MVTYLPRSAWTSSTASGSTLTGAKLVGVAVHWPGTTQDIIGDPGQEAIASRLRGYRDHHVNNNGWRDIGYNLAIDQGGRVWMLRSTQRRGNMIGAHCASVSNPDANEKYVGVLLVLGQTEQPSAKMIGAFQDWYQHWLLPGWPGRTDVRGHRQVPGAQTNCPGNRAIATLDEFTNQPSEDDDMPYNDWPQADQDALARDVASRVAGILVPDPLVPDENWRFAFSRLRKDAYRRPVEIMARLAGIEALLAQVIAGHADDLTEDKIRQLLAEAVVNVTVTVDTNQEG